MAELKTIDYKRFRDGFEAQYKILLVEKESELQSIEASRRAMYEQICSKWIEYEMVCDLYGIDSPKDEKISNEITMLIQKYDAQEKQTKMDELKKEIEWLKTKIH